MVFSRSVALAHPCAPRHKAVVAKMARFAALYSSRKNPYPQTSCQVSQQAVGAPSGAIEFRLIVAGAHRAEIHAEASQLAVKMRALHADALGQFAHFAVTQNQLLLQICPFELFARLAQGQ